MLNLFFERDLVVSLVSLVWYGKVLRMVTNRFLVLLTKQIQVKSHV